MGASASYDGDLHLLVNEKHQTGVKAVRKQRLLRAGGGEHSRECRTSADNMDDGFYIPPACVGAGVGVGVGVGAGTGTGTGSVIGAGVASETVLEEGLGEDTAVEA